MTSRLPAVFGSIYLCILCAGCTSSLSPPPSQTERTVNRGVLSVQSDFDLPADHRLLDDLLNLEQRFAEILLLPKCDRKIRIVLFANEAAYREFMVRKFPTAPARSAVFVMESDLPYIYSFWGPKLRRDLRHEFTHAYLHCLVPNVPLWLDEGLAENFESTSQSTGMNSYNLRLLMNAKRDGQSLADLSQLQSWQDPAALSELQYAECWAWAHVLLHTTPNRRTQLQEYLARLRIGAPAGDSIHDWPEIVAAVDELVAD